jgi:hypothetical protein
MTIRLGHSAQVIITQVNPFPLVYLIVVALV